MRLTQRAPEPRQRTPGLRGGSLRTPFGQSGSLCGLKLVPANRRCLVPEERRDGAQSRPPEGNASRWAVEMKFF
jgi:hypothetical protein